MKLKPHSSRDIAVPWVVFACSDRLIIGLTDTGQEPEPGWPKELEYQVSETNYTNSLSFMLNC